MTTTSSTSPDKKPDAASAPAAAPAAAPAPPSDTVTLTVDGMKITAKKGTLLVEAAKLAHVDVPVFCYHEKLKPVGACRMCLVEIEKMPRLQTACTTPVAEGMVVRTQSDLAKGGQNATVSLLLANHPLDCPVCDKGGECPLQDNTFAHGVGTSKFEEDKRHKDKAFELSDNIVLDRERCILCYRCVRFHEEIPGDRALAVLDRGSHGEIGVAPGERYDSPFQGNVVDICPVGALTSRHYRFRSRPWDLAHTDSIAADDPVGSNIVVDTRDGRVLRVRPRDNAQLNDAWIADRTRWGTMPAERTERLGQPLVRKNGKLTPTTWFEALRAAAQNIRHHKVGVLASPALSNEALAVVGAGAFADVAVWPHSPSWNARGTIASIGRSKSILVAGLDPWTQLPMLALWIHRAVASTAAGPGGASLVVLNDDNGLARDTKVHLKKSASEQLAALRDLAAALDGGEASADGKKAAAALAQGPSTVLVGPALAGNAEARALLEKIATKIGAIDADGNATGLVGAPSLYGNGRGASEILGERAHVDAMGNGGVLQRALAGQLDTVVLVGDAPVQAGGGCLVQAIGSARGVWLSSSVGKDGAGVPDFVDVVLPMAHAYEQAGSFTNLEGRHQGFDAAGIPPGNGPEKARADWAAIGALSTELGVAMPKDLKGLRAHFASTHAFAKLPPNRQKSRVELSIV